MNLDYLLSLDFGIAWEFRQALLAGLQTTIIYYVLGGSLGMVGALVLVAASRAPYRLVRWPTIAFVELFRNTPLLVQLVWIHFALPMVSGLRLTVFQSGLLALSLNASAYISEIFRAGIDAVPRGQIEACKVLGLGRYATWRHVILPQALRIVLPPLANMMVSLLKGTSILSIIAVAELMRATTRIGTHTARPVEIFTVTALIYFICGWLVLRAFAALEKRFALRT